MAARKTRQNHSIQHLLELPPATTTVVTTATTQSTIDTTTVTCLEKSEESQYEHPPQRENVGRVGRVTSRKSSSYPLPSTSPLSSHIPLTAAEITTATYSTTSITSSIMSPLCLTTTKRSPITPTPKQVSGKIFERKLNVNRI